MELDALVVNPDFLIGHLYPQHALFVGRDADNANFFVRVNHYAVANLVLGLGMGCLLQGLGLDDFISTGFPPFAISPGHW